MSQGETVRKLIDRMEDLVQILSERKDLHVHQRVDQFYYMQKVEELRMLLHQFESLSRNMENLMSRIHMTYGVCAPRWCRDVRWLNRYTSQLRSKPIL